MAGISVCYPELSEKGKKEKRINERKKKLDTA